MLGKRTRLKISGKWLPRLWTSAFVAQQQPGFTWDHYVVECFRIPRHCPGDRIASLVNRIKGIYEMLEAHDLCSILAEAKRKWSADFWGTATDLEPLPNLREELTNAAGEDQGKVVEAEITAAPQPEVKTEVQAVDLTFEAVEGMLLQEPTDLICDLAAVTTHPTVAKPLRHPVLELFLEDMLLGLGMVRSEVERRYVNNEAVHEISLNEKIRLIKNKVMYKLSTYRSYIRTTNLFLLWLNEEDPHLWKDSGILLATQHSIYAFLEDYRTGKIRATGTEPAISQVLNGTATFHRQTSQLPLSSANGMKLINALNFLYDSQQMLLNAVKVESLRSYRMFSLWENNLQFAETERRNMYLPPLPDVIAQLCLGLLMIVRGLWWLQNVP